MSSYEDMNRSYIPTIADFTKPNELTEYQKNPPAFNCIGKIKIK